MPKEISKVTDSQVCRKFLSIEQRSIEKEINFNLTFPDVKKLLKRKTCYYTGQPMVLTGKTVASNNSLTFDRKDNSKGYIKGNVVACTFSFNQLKDNLTIEQIKALSKTLL